MMEGHVRIPLAGTEGELVPSLGAAMTLCRDHGSFAALIDKLASYDMMAGIDVVHCGLARTSEQREETRGQVYETGMVVLVPHLIHFVGILANGGRPLPKEGEGEPTGPFDA
ncbi:hypothetical protein [Xanthobacter autotrophicus]|uniref:hypothetical protein n=1 Tax=Xanthobacter autotrophicus TaxID=280 RepID=UPI00372ABAFF